MQQFEQICSQAEGFINTFSDNPYVINLLGTDGEDLKILAPILLTKNAIIHSYENDPKIEKEAIVLSEELYSIFGSNFHPHIGKYKGTLKITNMPLGILQENVPLILLLDTKDISSLKSFFSYFKDYYPDGIPNKNVLLLLNVDCTRHPNDYTERVIKYASYILGPDVKIVAESKYIARYKRRGITRWLVFLSK